MSRTHRTATQALMSRMPEATAPAWSVDPQDTLGNAAVQGSLAPQLRGPGLCTDVGAYEVVPDDRAVCAEPVVEGTEVIAQSELDAAMALYDRVDRGEGSLSIDPVDRAGEVHPDFGSEARGNVGRLMQTRSGRQLVQDADTAPHNIVIVPSQAGDDHPGTLTTADALRQSDGTPGPGADAYVMMPEGLGPLPVMRDDGSHYDTPPEVIVGHELGHAIRDTHGQNAGQEPAQEEAFGNREEEQVIRDGPGVTEDDLLRERQLGPRFGHGLHTPPRPTD